MSRLCLTGYPGWLSCRFVDTLQKYPETYSSVSVLTQMKPQGLPSSSVAIRLFQGSLDDQDVLEEAVQNCDVVLHAAGVLHVKRIRDFYRINRDGTKNILDAACRNKVKKFIFISTNAAQGFCRGPGDELEESGACHPESHYGKSKYEAEEIVRSYHAAGKIQTVIIRPPMFYGPPVPPRHIDIFRKVSKGYFPVFGTGDYMRSVVFIDHLIQGIHLAMTKAVAVGQTYYIADREIPTLNDIIRSIAGALGRPVKIIRLPKWMAFAAQKLDDGISACDRYWMLPHIVGESCKNIACRIDKAERELGYHPQLSFQEGYQRAVDWCREQKLI